MIIVLAFAWGNLKPKCRKILCLLRTRWMEEFRENTVEFTSIALIESFRQCLFAMELASGRCIVHFEMYS